MSTTREDRQHEITTKRVMNMSREDGIHLLALHYNAVASITRGLQNVIDLKRSIGLVDTTEMSNRLYDELCEKQLEDFGVVFLDKLVQLAAEGSQHDR